jgi:hypothetical protein
LNSSFDPTTLSTKYTIIPKIAPQLSDQKWNWPKIHTLPRFANLDEVKPGVIHEWSDTYNDKEEEFIFCSKEEVKGYANKKHTAGMFVGCCGHGFGYGFHPMVSLEGRKTCSKCLMRGCPKKY